MKARGIAYQALHGVFLRDFAYEDIVANDEGEAVGS